MFTYEASSSASLNPAEPALTESTGRNAVQSIDVFLSLLKPAHGERSPILVVTSNNSDHLRARAALAALAESQLELLSGCMPQHAIQFLALQSTAAVPQNVGQLARAHKGVTLLFMDIVGFTAMSKAVEPQEIMVFLNTLFSLFDQLTNMHCVHKVETAGDCYIVSSGIMSSQQSTDGFQVVAEEEMDPAVSARQVMECAKAMLEVANQVKMPDTHQPVRIRVGLHTGNVVSGLIGSKLPKFSVFGDAMCMASRMESTGVPGRIHVSATTRDLLPHENWEAKGLTEVKGKGPMETFLWIPEPAAAPSMPLNLITSPQSTTGSLPCILLKQTQSLLKQMNARNPTSGSQWLGDALPLVLGGECEPK
ncbi:nucleotide cyclase [Dunaliella salina]|uniref:Nucleotide cyclase n=1 Tax=Dunaliella salina TaxID=3046 RepID=A0ABQ7GDI3_DUNSA|nr:nucleotide cyclase [Dunaliella salina]|eukprot:KAF5832603.1 nucleotide cyclase [Dunaliella salina]